jgi:3'(2'), 5'-bisphosphate nucleotidase
MRFDAEALSTLLDSCIGIADLAGEEILRVYDRPEIAATLKDDSSPLTEADLAAHNVIVPALENLTPDILVVSEESAEKSEGEGVFWLVDPLDGTKEFINRNGEFTVNIALIENGVPVLGVVLAPALGVCYAGARSLSARRREKAGIWQNIAARCPAAGCEIIVGSKSHGSAETTDWATQNFPSATFRGIGSSLKFCLIAEGQAHIYPRFGRTMEWDTAAGHAVLMAAGGCVTTREGAPFTYGKPGFENPHFIARDSGQY